MQLLRANFEYNHHAVTLIPGRPGSFDEVFVDFQSSDAEGGTRYTIFIHPKADISIQKLELEFLLPAVQGLNMLANGFLPENACDMKPCVSGKIESWTYTLLQGGRHSLFAGSLSEGTGFSVWSCSGMDGTLRMRKEIEGLHLTHSFPALDVWVAEGFENDLYDKYARLMDIAKPAPVPGLVWTSRGLKMPINESLIRQRLDAVQESGLPFHTFVVGKGWETETGDWLRSKPAFSGGMAALAAQIRGKGLRPGLYLAPLLASGQSELVKQHPDWLLRGGRKSLPLLFEKQLVLDFYKPAVQEYLSGVFHLVFEKWNFELVALDGLAAACLAIPPGKTRGQVMLEFMSFLRLQAGNRLLAASGAPAAAAFGKTEIYSLPAVAGTARPGGLFGWWPFGRRENPLESLRRILGQWQLDRRIFLTDPGEFTLSESEKTWTQTQQYTLLTVKTLLGGFLSTSDDPMAYNSAQREKLQEVLALQESTVHSVLELQRGIFRIDFWQEEIHYKAMVNLNELAVRTGPGTELPAFTTVILKA